MFQTFLARKCPKRYPEMCWKFTLIRSRSIQTHQFGGGGGVHRPPAVLSSLRSVWSNHQTFCLLPGSLKLGPCS